MIKKIRIKNFKCLRDTGDLEIKPITFFVGPNSSGKSSVMQLLLMLRQTVDSTDNTAAIVTNDGWVQQMGAYPEFIFGRDTHRNLQIHLEFETAKKGAQEFTKKDEQNYFYLDVIFTYNQKTTQIQLKESNLAFKNSDVKRNIVKLRGKNYVVKISGYGKSPNKLATDKVVPRKFYDYFLSPTFKDLREKNHHLLIQPISKHIFLDSFSNQLEWEFKKFFYLGPLRDSPKRFYVFSGQSSQDVGIRGERATDVLWYSNKKDFGDFKELEKIVQYWFKELCFANKIRLDAIPGEYRYQVTVTDMQTNIETNLADIGFGASQTLPIIVESFCTPSDSLILIEQPEIHLHPRAQTSLGDMFIDAIKNSRRNFIIETHSEHLLARIRRRIAEKKLNKEDVALYYFEPTKNGTKIKRIKLNEKGQFVNFPKGFFEEDINEAFEHLKALQ